ncbi:metallophosphoesterase family protein [Hyalangium gracile]|uniref:hypothetical protein n=1 Tax=Hyalangium gracile TaxID=394092 RepID=UPI001CCB9BE1|nr:hypothetical protein [Hyalangium gracile]
MNRIGLIGDIHCEHVSLAAVLPFFTVELLRELETHSHRRMVRTIEGLTLINAGTLHRDHEPCFALVDLSRGEVSFHDIHDDWIAEPPQVHRLPA